MRCVDLLVKEDLTIVSYEAILQEREPVIYGGVVISENDELVVEMIEGHTSGLLYGTEVPYRLTKNNHEIQCRYSTEDHAKRQLLWGAISCIYRHPLTPLGGDFLPGYFEFYYTQSSSGHLRLRYYNYKTSSTFTSLQGKQTL